ncbi:hypothetical protein MMC34_008339 [Xylographa carneopallida]|nr:hypothetical protein [Xylographa carneopallida]
MSTYSKSPSCFSRSSFGSGGDHTSPPHFFRSTKKFRDFNTRSSSPPPRFSVYQPEHLSPLKRKRGIDTLSSSVKNPDFSIYISGRNDNFGVDKEDAELPPAKKVKVHHMTKIITGSGEVEHHPAVCPVHAALDISLPVRGCEDCIRVEKLLGLYIERYQAFRGTIRKADEFYSSFARKTWDKSRLAFAKYRFEVDKARIQVPASPLSRHSASTKPRPARRPSVRFDHSALTDSSLYRRDGAFRRGLSTYVPGRHADTSGSGFLNTCDPKKQNFDEWRSPPLQPPRRVQDPTASCRKRCHDSLSGSYSLPPVSTYKIQQPLRQLKHGALWVNHMDDHDEDPRADPMRGWREGTPFRMKCKTLRQYEQSDRDDDEERKRNLAYQS